MEIGISIGVCAGSQIGATAPASIQLSLDPDAGEVVTTTEVDGLITWTIVGGPYEGEWSAAREDIAAAPQCLVPAAISGTATVGSTLSVDPVGLWVYDEALGAPTITGEWYSGTTATGGTDDSYTVVSGDAGEDVTYIETATQGAVSTAQASNAISIPAAAGVTITRLGTNYYGWGGTVTPSINVDTSGLSAGDDLLLFVGMTRAATACTVNGESAGSAIGSSGGTSGSNNNVTAFAYTLTADDIGESIPIAFVMASSFVHGRIAVFAVRGASSYSAAGASRMSSATDLTATPSGTLAGLLAVFMSVAPFSDNPMTWGGVTLIENEDTVVAGSGLERAVGSASAISPASNTVTASTGEVATTAGMVAVGIIA